MVSAWACANGLVLGQIKTEEKSNEITAIPELLKMLEIKGCIVTIDAGHGKIEIRRYRSVSDISWLQGKESWKNLKTIYMVERERQFKDKTDKETSYYIGSVENNAVKKSIQVHHLITLQRPAAIDSVSGFLGNTHCHNG